MKAFAFATAVACVLALIVIGVTAADIVNAGVEVGDAMRGLELGS